MSVLLIDSKSSGNGRRRKQRMPMKNEISFSEMPHFYGWTSYKQKKMQQHQQQHWNGYYNKDNIYSAQHSSNLPMETLILEMEKLFETARHLAVEEAIELARARQLYASIITRDIDI